MSTRPACPRCNAPLAADADDDSALRCSACGGVLLKSADLNLALLSETTEAPGAAVASTDAVETPTETQPIGCPLCGQAMSPVALNDVEIDRCEACNAVWLDAGEEPGGQADESLTAGQRISRSLLYTLTLPERTLRSGVGVAAGAVQESAKFLVPRAFQSSKTYEIVVKNSLKFLAENVGGVKSAAGGEQIGQDFAARKAVGNFVDLAGWATLGLSPVWFMAIVSDVAYGSKTYVAELAGELKREGLIDENSVINGVDDVLSAVQNASGRTATLVDTPPLSVDQLKQTLDETRTALKSADYRRVLPEAELKQYWQEMKDISKRENVSFIGVSGALTMHTLGKVATVGKGTLTGVRVVGGLFSRHVVGHYVESLKEVKQRGFYTVLKESSTPYIEAVWNNFGAQRETWTEEIVTGRLFGKAYRAVTGWFTRKKTDETPPAADQEVVDPSQPAGEAESQEAR